MDFYRVSSTLVAAFAESWLMPFSEGTPHIFIAIHLLTNQPGFT